MLDVDGYRNGEHPHKTITPKAQPGMYVLVRAVLLLVAAAAVFSSYYSPGGGEETCRKRRERRSEESKLQDSGFYRIMDDHAGTMGSAPWVLIYLSSNHTYSTTTSYINCTRYSINSAINKILLIILFLSNIMKLGRKDDLM